ncbi:receptor-like protein 7 [Cornus florida]|uniref:receptor-like protein 7 n=1 Tax=Cornus florida TaxID=4283 RepID=UPI00289EAA3F|nr:receptor-like protein 7 [Cornus florida]
MIQLIQRLHRGIPASVIAAHGTVSLEIGLDLSSSFLSGFINSSSTLFRLVHLQTLNLADNYFNESQIPSAIGLLSRLTYLNLSFSIFAGQNPLEISSLTKLTFLDLSRNSTELLKPGLTSLVQNVTGLKELYLSGVNMSSTVTHNLANFSSLTSLFLQSCELQGEFPPGIFKLPNLQFLSVQNNPDLNVYLPEFHMRSPLKKLELGSTNFSGELPNSIGNLYSLNELDISGCTFSGSILSASIGNLAQLLYLSLSGSNFFGELPNSMGQLKSLNRLEMSRCNFSGPIPSWFGQIPSSFGNFTQLQNLRLSFNLLHGPIHESISQLVNLQVIYLDGNNLTVELDVFLTLKNLTTLELSVVLKPQQQPYPKAPAYMDMEHEYTNSRHP